MSDKKNEEKVNKTIKTTEEVKKELHNKFGKYAAALPLTILILMSPLSSKVSQS